MTDHPDVRVEFVDQPATLYRVCSTSRHHGLWYDENGHEIGLIHTLSEGNAKVLPMGPHPIFRADGKHWFSTASSLEALNFWFSEADRNELGGLGFMTEAIHVRRFRRLHFATYSHEVYCPEDVVAQEFIDQAKTYEQAA